MLSLSELAFLREHADGFQQTEELQKRHLEIQSLKSQIEKQDDDHARKLSEQKRKGKKIAYIILVSNVMAGCLTRVWSIKN